MIAFPYPLPENYPADSYFWYSCIAACVFLLFLAMQLWFFFSWFRHLYRPKATHVLTGKMHPVSVIICVKNRLQHVKPLVDAVLNQDYPEFEIVLVDDNSHDEVYDYLLMMRDTFPHVHLTRLHGSPETINAKKYALTIGIKGAKFEHILLTDDDCLPLSNNWIYSMQHHFTPGVEIVTGYSPYRRYPGILNALVRYETFYTGIQYLSSALAGRPYMGVGRNLSYTKGVFFANKGFYKIAHITGGDDDLFVNKAVQKGNLAIALEHDSFVESEPVHSFEAWKRQKTRHFSVGKYYKPGDKMRTGMLAATNAGFWLSFIVTASFFYSWPLALAGLLVRNVVLLIQLSRFRKVLNERFSIWQLFWLDAVYWVVHLYFGIIGLRKKRVTW